MMNLKKLFLLFCCMHGAMFHEKTLNAVYRIDDIFIKRWSSRAFSGELLSQEELMTLFEAARWAPSSYNEQPWRFLYANRDDENWDTFFNFLVPFNQLWCQRASTLVVVISYNVNHRGEMSPTHSFDAGAAWENLALQASALGLIAHGMSGFDYDKARIVLEIPADYTIEAMIAIGKPGDMNDLPPALQAIEKRSERKPLNSLIFAGKFKQNHKADEA